MPAPVQHFHLMMKNVDGSQAFYQNVFGWSFNQQGSNWEIKSGSDVIGTFRQPPPRVDSAVIPFFTVTNIVTAKQIAIEGNQAELFEDITPIPNVGGCYVILRDIENGLFGIYQP